jgi:hypothetical protein
MNVAKLLQQAQRAQEQMQKALTELEVEASSGGGLVRVRLNGVKELKAVHLDPQVLAGEDAAIVEDLIVAAWQEAARLVEERSQQLLGKIGLPPGFPGLP